MKNFTMYSALPSDMKLDRERSKEITGFASIDKPWLKYYTEKAATKELPKKTFYRYAKDNNEYNMGMNAIKYYGFKMTYKKFFDMVDRVANSFAALGVKKGDIVTICSPTFPETIISNYALNKIGAVANNIDPRTNAKRIEENLNKVNSKYLIALDIAFPKINSIIRNTNVKMVVCNSYTDSVPALFKPIFKKKVDEMLTKKGLPIPNIAFDCYDGLYVSWKAFMNIGENTVAKEVEYTPNMPAGMVLTGGTTGLPKSVELTNDTVIALIEQYKDTDLGLKRGQSLLNIMPGFIA